MVEIARTPTGPFKTIHGYLPCPIDLQKTKIDVFTSPFIIDTIPAIFIIIRNSLQKKRMQESRGRWQDCHPQDTAPGEDTECLCRVRMIHGFVVMAC
jgi:hypothetical protein